VCVDYMLYLFHLHMQVGACRILHAPTCLWRWNRQTVPKRRHIKFRRRGITQKKEYNIQDTAKVWNRIYLSMKHVRNKVHPAIWEVLGVGLQPLDCWDRSSKSLSVMFVVCCVSSDGLITRWEETYRVCVCVCVCWCVILYETDSLKLKRRRTK